MYVYYNSKSIISYRIDDTRRRKVIYSDRDPISELAALAQTEKGDVNICSSFVCDRMFLWKTPRLFNQWKNNPSRLGYILLGYTISVAKKLKRVS